MYDTGIIEKYEGNHAFRLIKEQIPSPKNESYKQAAIREGREESSGLLGNKQNINYLIENKTTDTITINGHRSYIVVIYYDEELPKKFRENFIKVKEKFPDRINKKWFYEKDKLLWIESTKLEENMNKFRPWYRIIVREIINKL